jgi:AcrR family transcriptional regulator
MATKRVNNRIAERKQRDRQARRAQIISAARRIAELEGWSNVTVRRLSDEISYSQPVLYAHFGSREGILTAVAIEGFQELGMALEQVRKRVKRFPPSRQKERVRALVELFSFPREETAWVKKAR